MKIGFFTDSFRPYTSGVVRSIETFTRELTNLGHEIFVFAPKYPDSVPEPRVFRFISIPSPTNQDFTLAIPFSPQLRYTARRLGLDVIHVHSPFLLGRLGARYARQNALPLVCTYHTLYDQYVHYVPIGKNLSKVIIRKITRDFCNMCDLVIAPTTVVSQVLVNGGVSQPIRIIPTGIELDEFNGVDRGWLRRQYGIGEQEKILLHVGRMSTEKNVELLLKSFARVYRHAPVARLVLVGGGPQSETLREMVAAMDLSRQVTFTGLLPREEVVKCYAGADLFVFASVTETQGIVLGEAKAAGLPVVAVRAFGAAEMVVDGSDGYLTEPTEEALAGRILQVIQDDGLRLHLSASARENVKQISSRACASRMADAYEQQILEKGRAPGRRKQA